MKNYYEVRGNVVVIYLDRKDGTRLETSISKEDLKKVSSFEGKWYATSTSKPYAVMTVKRKAVYLHRVVTGAEEGKVVDHFDHNTLNNTRENLRVVSHAENHQNRESYGERELPRGVYFYKRAGKWKAQFQLKGDQIFVGYFDTMEEADEAVKKARQKLMPFSAEGGSV